MKKGVRNVLGRGLSSLISATPVPVNTNLAGRIEAPDEYFEGGNPPNLIKQAVSRIPMVETSGVTFLGINLIKNNPTQPRQEFDSQELSELADSIRSLGVLQPVLVRPEGDGTSGFYEIVAGERRWRAGKLAGLTEIPVLIKEIDDRQSLEIALVENVQRAALNPVEEARAYERLINEFSLSQKEVAERVGKDRVSIANTLRILKLPEEILTLVREEKLSLGHAKAILSVKEPSAQISLAKKAIAEGLSVRALETIVSRVVVLDTGKRRANNSSSIQGEERYKSSAFPEIIDRIRLSLGTKVNIYHHPSGRGRIEIEYFSEQELDRLVDHVCIRESSR